MLIWQGMIPFSANFLSVLAMCNVLLLMTQTSDLIPRGIIYNPVM